MTPQTPPDCPHFASHDYGNGRGYAPIFWCSEPFWSHDHGEPWILNDPLTAMKRVTIAAIAEKYWRKAIQKHYEACRVSGEWPEHQAQEYREIITAWREWSA